MGKLKITCILFIIMVSLMTFSFTQDKKVDDSKVVTENEVASYKEIILNAYTHNGYCYLTEEQINQKVQEYIDIEINSAKSKAKGMEFKEAFRISLIISGICCVSFYLFYSMHGLHLKERRYTGYWVSDTYEERKAFHKKLQESIFNKEFKNK